MKRNHLICVNIAYGNGGGIRPSNKKMLALTSSYQKGLRQYQFSPFAMIVYEKK